MKLKRYIQKTILVIVLCISCLSLYSQGKPSNDYKLVVTLRNAPFNTLSLIDYNDKKTIFIDGKKIDQFKWEFIISDSIVLNSEYMMLAVPDKDTVANAYHQIRFFRNFGNTNTSLVNIGVQYKLNYIEADYKEQTLFEKEKVSIFSKTDSTVIGNLICDDFDLVVKNDSSDIMVRSFEPNFGWFMNLQDQSHSSYEKKLQSYINLSKQFPNSRYLVTYLALNLYKFKTRKDVKSIYENFSNTWKELKWSKKIENYLSGDFINSSLVNLDTKQLEPIVQNISKYNLITFSASWCIPCIEEIPLLKDLYKDLNRHVNFTYISIDDQKDIRRFQDLLIKYEVTWRTLYAYKDLEKVKELYFVVGIPHSLLIYPDGHMEVMDIRNEENQKKLYMLK